ncbi:hypothetical protein EK21DRAFT_118673 [Setomelanomma holmii]|uniref:Uncharacterized protein n=1 Tax=Setomelanomma holmii TaxID=210430 RepID=A0A9P4GXZ3_9PLEO|nr:hypothetical protein EK21DRAFT_118673 [Setomelanomma holmii]
MWLDELEQLGAIGWFMFLLNRPLFPHEADERVAMQFEHMHNTEDKLRTMIENLKEENRELVDQNKKLKLTLYQLDRDVDKSLSEYIAKSSDQRTTSSVGVDIASAHNTDGAVGLTTADIAAVQHLQHDLEVIVNKAGLLARQDQTIPERNDVNFRVGMGGQLEDEEHVYIYADCKDLVEVTDQEEMLKEAARFGERQQSVHDTDAEADHIEQLRNHIARLEAEIMHLENQKRAHYESLRSASLQNIPGSYEQTSEATSPTAYVRPDGESTQARGNSTPLHAEITSHSPVFMKLRASPFLCQPFGAVIVRLHKNFSLRLHDGSRSFPDPITVYHFPYATGGASKSIIWNQILRLHDKFGEEAEFIAETLIEVTVPEMEKALKEGIVELHNRTEDSWEGLGQGDTFIILDQDLAWDVKESRSHNRTANAIRQDPTLRGGSGDDHDAYSTSGLADEHRIVAEEFEAIYDQLMQNTVNSCGQGAPSLCTQAWMSLASALHGRNKYLEHQFKDFRELRQSLVEDIEWHISTLAEVEESLEVTREDKAVALTELGFLSKKLDKVSGAMSEPSSGSASSQNVSIEREEKRTPTSWDTRTADEISHRLTNGACIETVCNPRDDTESGRSYKDGMPNNYFWFFPKQCVIRYDSDFPHLFRFSGTDSLKQIEAILHNRFIHGTSTDAVEHRIWEILQMREDMGIELPDTSSDACLIIGIPSRKLSLSMDPGVRIAAWGTTEPAQENMVMSQPEMVLAEGQASVLPPATSDCEALIREIGDSISSLGRLADLALYESAPSICSCFECTAITSDRTTTVPRTVSVRGGGGDDDSDDDYDSDDEYDEDDDTGDEMDTDDEDEEITHEEEAHDPWEERGPSAAQTDDDLSPLVWDAENPLSHVAFAEELHGGGQKNGTITVQGDHAVTAPLSTRTYMMEQVQHIHNVYQIVLGKTIRPRRVHSGAMGVVIASIQELWVL